MNVKKFTTPDGDGRFGWVMFLFDNQRITLKAYYTWHNEPHGLYVYMNFDAEMCKLLAERDNP